MSMKYIWNSLMLTLMLLMSSLSMLAQEQESESDHKYIIREDRVWEYVKQVYPTMGNEIEELSIYRVRFNGSETIDGVEYSQLVFDGGIKKTIRWYDPKTDIALDPPLVIESEMPSPDWLPCYMREDHGMVFCNSNWEKRYFPEDDILYEDELIYDFSKAQGESFDTYVYSIGHISEPCSNLISFSVTDVSNRIVNDEEYKECALSPSYDYYWSNGYKESDLKLIEGIGLVDVNNNFATGTIAHIEGTALLANTYQEYANVLNNVYDMDGNVIYKGFDRQMPTGIRDIDSEIKNKTESTYYNLQGMPIEKPEQGFYIERRNGRSIKHLK